MRKALLSFLCMATCWLCIPTSLKAQSADERIENPINPNNWFELQRQLAVTPQDSVTPFLYLMGKSLTQHHFNQPQKACQTLQTLLQNHQQELGYHNSLNMAVLLSASLARSHQYKQAAELLQSLVQQLEALQTDSTYAASLKKSAAYCQSLAPIENICQQLTPLTEAQQIPMIKDTIKFTKDLINIHGQINGKSSPMLFDTGASINIISSSDADKYGLRKLGSSYTVIGIGTASGQVARGCLKIKNRDRLTYNL